MTVTNTNFSQTFFGNGVATSFPFSVISLSVDHVKAELITSGNIRNILLQNVDFSVQLNTDGTSTITFPLGSSTFSILAAGESLDVFRDVPLTQEISLNNQGPYDAKAVEAGLDISRQIDQQLVALIGETQVDPDSTTIRVIISGDYQALIGDSIGVRSDAVPVTITAPDLPKEGNVFFVSDVGHNAKTNVITIDFSVDGFEGSLPSFSININRFGTGFIYLNNTWEIISNAATRASEALGNTSNLVITNANYQAVIDNYVAVRSDVAAVTITAPNVPSQGDSFFVSDVGHSAKTNNITVDFGGDGFEGMTSVDFIINVDRFGTGFIFIGNTWEIVANGAKDEDSVGTEGTIVIGDEGSVVNTAGIINFVGAGVTAADAGGGEATVTIPGNTPAVTEVSSGASYNVLAGDGIILVNKTIGSGTIINLPIAGSAGRTLVIKDKKGDATANPITLNPDGSDAIDGQVSFVLRANGSSATLVSQANEWSIL